MGQKNNSKFQTGSGCYTCADCGKLTRETGASESLLDRPVCRDCHTEAGLECEHQDGHHHNDPNPDCPMCKEDADVPTADAQPEPKPKRAARLSNDDKRRRTIDLLEAKRANLIEASYNGTPPIGFRFSFYLDDLDNQAKAYDEDFGIWTEVTDADGNFVSWLDHYQISDSQFRSALNGLKEEGRIEPGFTRSQFDYMSRQDLAEGKARADRFQKNREQAADAQDAFQALGFKSASRDQATGWTRVTLDSDDAARLVAIAQAATEALAALQTATDNS